MDGIAVCGTIGVTVRARCKQRVHCQRSPTTHAHNLVSYNWRGSAVVLDVTAIYSGHGAAWRQKKKSTVHARTNNNPAPLSIITIGALLIAIAFRPYGTRSPRV